MRVPIVPILSTLQLHRCIDCCLPSYVVISLLSSVYRLFCTSPGALHYVASLTCFSPANYLLITCYRLLFASTSFTVISLLFACFIPVIGCFMPASCLLIAPVRPRVECRKGLTAPLVAFFFKTFFVRPIEIIIYHQS